jgi:fatty acid synthase subunit beta
MDGRNDRIKEFYHRVRFGDDSVPFNIRIISEHEGGQATITGRVISDFAHAAGNTGEAYVDCPGKEVFAPMDLVIVVGWKAIMKSLFPSRYWMVIFLG